MYNAAYFEAISSSCQLSASVVVPEIVSLFTPSSVVDVGCAGGAWLAEFRRCGVEDLLGVDGPWLSEFDKFPPVPVMYHDLTEPLLIDRKFDLVVCLEVAEHLPCSSADTLVDSLVKLGTVVLFSAAVPGQGGHGHINEKPTEWWIQKFGDRGYDCVDGFRQRFIGNPNVAWWYWQNMRFFVSRDCQRAMAIQQGSFTSAPQVDWILPVILSCARNETVAGRFVSSYLANVVGRLPSPLVVLDASASQETPPSYLRTLLTLDPEMVVIHSRVPGVSIYDSVQDAAAFTLRTVAHKLGDRRAALFLEDDVLLSSRLVEYLTGFQQPADMGFLTLYLPRNGYGSTVVDPEHFYGTQCVLFSKEGLDAIVGDHDAVMRIRPGYDIRWSRFLASRGFRLYASPKSFVQHIGLVSQLHDGAASHTSYQFIE